MKTQTIPESKKQIIKYLYVDEITILGSENVDDTVFRAAKQIILKITSKRPEIRTHLSGYECILVAPGESLLDSIKWDKNRSRPPAGLALRSQSQLGFPGRFAASIVWKKKPSMHVFIHEFGHAIESVISIIDPEYDSLIKRSFKKAMKLGLWQDEPYFKRKSDYNPVSEYWAEGVRRWYSVGKGHKFKSRDEFKKYDPELTHILAYWLSEEEIPLIY